MSDCGDVFDWVSRLKKTYQPVEGFGDKIAPARVEGFKKILDALLQHCGDVEGKSFLDIGSNFGYFCLELAKRGAVTHGIERDSRRSTASQCMALKLGLEDAHFSNEDALEFVKTTAETFDYVILLNVFHHVLVQDEAGGWEMFNKLVENTEGVFIMMRNALKGWKLCDGRTQIPQSILNASNATDFVAYPAVHGRVVYFFWKH